MQSGQVAHFANLEICRLCCASTMLNVLVDANFHCLPGLLQLVQLMLSSCFCLRKISTLGKAAYILDAKMGFVLFILFQQHIERNKRVDLHVFLYGLLSCIKLCTLVCNMALQSTAKRSKVLADQAQRHMVQVRYLNMGSHSANWSITFSKFWQFGWHF